MYNGMLKLTPAVSLWFIAAIVIGNYILLNLFLAILLENFSSTGPSDGTGSRSLRSASSGSTLAAAAQMAVIHEWMQDLLRCSWFGKLLHDNNNKVHTLPGMEGVSGNWVAGDADGNSSNTNTPHTEASRDFAASLTPRQGSHCDVSPDPGAAVLGNSVCDGQHASGTTAAGELLIARASHR